MSAFGFALCAAAVWGLSAFLEKWGLGHADPTAGVLARTLGVLAGILVFLLVAPQVPMRFYHMGWKPRLALMTGGLLASIVAQLFFYRALKPGEVGRVAAVGASWPVFAFVLSVLFLGERVTGSKVVGIALVVLGAAFLR